MTLTYRISDSHGDNYLTEKDFPVILGSTFSAGILIKGLDKDVEAAVIKLEDFHPHIQPVHSAVPIFHNGKKLEKEVRLDHGDRISIGLSEILFQHTGG